MKYVPPDGFFGIQILLNSISSGVPARTPLEELMTLPRPLSRLDRGYTISIPHSPGRLRRTAIHAFGVEASHASFCKEQTLFMPQ